MPTTCSEAWVSTCICLSILVTALLLLKPLIFQDWWWKARLGKCYYQLGLLRESEKQFKSSLANQVRGACAYMQICCSGSGLAVQWLAHNTFTGVKQKDM